MAEHEKVSIVPNFTLTLPGGELRLIEVRHQPQCIPMCRISPQPSISQSHLPSLP
jgi:hypothetical protein